LEVRHIFAHLWRSLDLLQEFPATFTPLIQITGKKLLHQLNFKRMDFKSSYKMRQTVLGVKCKAKEWRRAERWGLRWNACATRRTFSGVHTVRGGPGGFLL